MISTFISRIAILVFGTLFPAYYSYKAVKTKNVKEYVKWMMYWIVFAFFTCFETITDLFFSFWFPFYYELKILVVLWLLSPATRGSSILYRNFVHPWLARREEDIDDCIAKAKQQGYSTVLQLGTYATTVLVQTALKGGGGIINQLREFNEGDLNRNLKALPPIQGDDDLDGQFDLSSHSGSTAQLHELDEGEDLNLNLKALPHILEDDFDDQYDISSREVEISSHTSGTDENDSSDEENYHPPQHNSTYSKDDDYHPPQHKNKDDEELAPARRSNRRTKTRLLD